MGEMWGRYRGDVGRCTSATELVQAVRSPRGLRAAARTPRASTAPLELRLLSAIPIANWQLVLPFSRPSFQLKDWARLDLVTPPALPATISRLYLAHISPISPISRQYLAHISQVTLPALLATLASLRYDSPSLNVAAAFTITLWIARTALAYRNVLTRYELLLNRFLRDKTAIRENLWSS